MNIIIKTNYIIIINLMESDLFKRNIRDFYKVGDTIGKGGFATVKKAKNK